MSAYDNILELPSEGTAVLNITIQADAGPYNVSGCHFTMLVKNNIDDPDGDAIATFLDTNGTIIVDRVQGLNLCVPFNSGFMDLLDPRILKYFCLTMTTSDGTVQALQNGSGFLLLTA